MLEELGDPRLIARTIIDSFIAEKGPMADFYTKQARDEYRGNYDNVSSYDNNYEDGLFSLINMAQPFNSPGIIDGKLVTINPGKYEGILMNNNALARYYGQGYDRNTSNTMNMDLSLTQKLDFITKGLSVEVKGAYNTSYSFLQQRHGSVES